MTDLYSHIFREFVIRYYALDFIRPSLPPAQSLSRIVRQHVNGKLSHQNIRNFFSHAAGLYKCSRIVSKFINTKSSQLQRLRTGLTLDNTSKEAERHYGYYSCHYIFLDLPCLYYSNHRCFPRDINVISLHSLISQNQEVRNRCFWYYYLSHNNSAHIDIGDLVIYQTMW